MFPRKEKEKGKCPRSLVTMEGMVSWNKDSIPSETIIHRGGSRKTLHCARSKWKHSKNGKPWYKTGVHTGVGKTVLILKCYENDYKITRMLKIAAGKRS